MISPAYGAEPEEVNGQNCCREAPPDTYKGFVGSMVPYRNAMALAAYYVAVASLIPVLGLILGIAAVVLGVMGLKYHKQHPESKGKAHALVGIILGGLCFSLNIVIPIIIIFQA